MDPSCFDRLCTNLRESKMVKSINAIRLIQLTGVTALFAVGAPFAQDQVPVEFGTGMANGFPESVTSTSDGALYAGSMSGGTLHRVEPGAAKAELWVEAPTEGPGAVIGVYADEAAGKLWACYADLAVFSGGEAMPSVLRSYDLESAEETGSFTFPEGSFCNDIATLEDGTAFAADTAGSRVLRIAPDGEEAEVWFEDEQLAGVDGLSFGPDGALYLNSVTTNKLFRLDMGSDGAAGTLTELTTSEPLQGPDGMRFGPDGILYLAENAAGRVDAVTIEGDNAQIEELKGGFEQPTAVTLVDDTLWIAEAKLGLLGGQEDPGTFYLHPVALGAASSGNAASSGVRSTEETSDSSSQGAAGYQELVSSFANLSDADLAGVTDIANVKIVRLSELPEATSEEAAALEQALTDSQADREAMQETIEANELTGPLISELGISSEDIITVQAGEGGALTIFIDDRG
jgi:sugar lactone lactonase YvrE